MDQELFLLLLAVVRFESVGHQSVIRRDDALAGFDLGHELLVLRMDQRELELGHARKLLARFLDLRGIEPGDLHQDAVIAYWANDRFAAAEIVDPLADHLDRLVEHALGYFLLRADQPDEE